jgi:adenosylhomocysteine nucleosidase
LNRRRRTSGSAGEIVFSKIGSASMWQSLLRNWLMTQAKDRLREAASQAGEHATASSAQAPPQTAADQGPPEVQREVCHVGIVFAMGIEAGGVAGALAGVVRTQAAGLVFREGGIDGRRVVLVESGVGREAAERATQALILGHQPQWIISAGYAGGLSDRVAQGDFVLADEIVDSLGRSLAIDFKLAPNALALMPHVHVGRLLTVDRVVARAEDKRSLGQKHAALAVEMETMGVAETCRREKIRFLSVRIISDAIDRTLPDDIDYLIKRKSTAGRLGAAAGAILRRPSSVKDMWQLKEDALVASDRLARFLVGVIGQLR